MQSHLLIYFFLHLTFASPPSSLTFQPWWNLEAIPPLRHSGSHLIRSITLCLFQLKLTPFAVNSMVIPCRKVTHPCYTHCPWGLVCFWMYIMLLQGDLYCQMAVQRLDLQNFPCGKMCAQCVVLHQNEKWFETHLTLTSHCITVNCILSVCQGISLQTWNCWSLTGFPLTRHNENEYDVLQNEANKVVVRTVLILCIVLCKHVILPVPALRLWPYFLILFGETTFRKFIDDDCLHNFALAGTFLWMSHQAE